MSRDVGGELELIVGPGEEQAYIGEASPAYSSELSICLLHTLGARCPGELGH